MPAFFCSPFVFRFSLFVNFLPLQLNQFHPILEIFDSDLFRSVAMILLDLPVAGFSIGVIAGILAIIVLLAGSAMASGAEVAFFSLGPNQLHELRLKEDKADQGVLHLLEMPKHLLATFQLMSPAA
jgi:putative hemolysin